MRKVTYERCDCQWCRGSGRPVSQPSFLEREDGPWLERAFRSVAFALIICVAAVIGGVWFLATCLRRGI